MKSRYSIDDFEEWLNNPITLDFIKLIKDEAQAHREMASTGLPLGAGSFEKIGEKYFSIINTAMAYENLLDNLTYDNISQEETFDNDEIHTSGEQTLN